MLILLLRISTLMCDIDIAILSVRPSHVRLSVRNIPVSDENGLTYCHSFVTGKHFPTGSRPAGALNTGGVKKIRDFLPISRYISQTIQNIAIVKVNRNSYAIYQMVLFPLTLNEP